MMMKEVYETPVMEVIEFEAEDIITASITIEDNEILPISNYLMD